MRRLEAGARESAGQISGDSAKARLGGPTDFRRRKVKLVDKTREPAQTRAS